MGLFKETDVQGNIDKVLLSCDDLIYHFEGKNIMKTSWKVIQSNLIHEYQSTYGYSKASNWKKFKTERDYEIKACEILAEITYDELKSFKYYYENGKFKEDMCGQELYNVFFNSLHYLAKYQVITEAECEDRIQQLKDKFNEM